MSGFPWIDEVGYDFDERVRMRPKRCLVYQRAVRACQSGHSEIINRAGIEDRVMDFRDPRLSGT